MASAAGMDPDQVMAGYEALRDGRITVDDIGRQMGRG